MKRLALLMALWICLLPFVSSSALFQKNNYRLSDTDTEKSFSLPASLKEIGESAFEGTAVETVIIQTSTHTIGDRAFAEIRTLKAVYIPDSVSYIGTHAFEGNFNFELKGEEGSYAAEWARLHQVAFTQLKDSVTGLVLKLLKLLRGSILFSIGLPCMKRRLLLWQRKRTEIWEKSMRPQDRPELYPINYRFP